MCRYFFKLVFHVVLKNLHVNLKSNFCLLDNTIILGKCQSELEKANKYDNFLKLNLIRGKQKGEGMNEKKGKTDEIWWYDIVKDKYLKRSGGEICQEALSKFGKLVRDADVKYMHQAKLKVS